jgi:pyrroline-5-carboxylate reductase
MGEALLRGWLGRGISPRRIAIFEPAPSAELLVLTVAQSIRLNPPVAEIDDAAVLVLAVKPQAMQDVLPQFLPLAQHGALVLSIAAGKSIGFFEQHFGNAAIVRAMPNTPAAIGQGMTVLCANAQVTAAQRKIAFDLMDAAGKVAWIDDEALMDPVTAVSGSGPAYVFLLIEALAQAGEKAGLQAELSYLLAKQTVSGAAALAAQSDQPAAQLRKNVTSPGGTTAAAMDVLMQPDGLQKLMDAAVLAATQRSRDLAK